MSRIEAVLFDLDGTLVDSIPAWLRANVQVLSHFGYSITPGRFYDEFYRRGLHHAGILEQCGLHLERAKDFYENRNDVFVDLLRTDVTWIGSAEKVLRECAKRFPLGIMTGSTQRCVSAIDACWGLKQYFRTIVAYDETGTRMKPDPYGLELLTSALGVTPADCLYVGDQPVDVLAARSIGMRSAILTSSSKGDISAQPDFLVSSLEDLLTIVDTPTL